jgi:ribosomal protein S10
MTFRTRLALESGDRDALQEIVRELRSMAEQKGAELKGPHSPPTSTLQVPQHKALDGDERFADWEYTVYSRELEIVGHEDLAREITKREFPESIHVEAEIKPVSPLGT